MPRTEGAKPFTDLEREAIIAQVSDYMLFNMSVFEIQQALEKRFKKPISKGTIKRAREVVLKRQGTADDWLDYHTRTELGSFYRQRIEELQYIQKNLFQILDAEKDKGPDKMNVYKYNQIAKTAIENSKVLAEFGLAPPVLSKIKQLLPLDINQLNARVKERKELSDNLSKKTEEDINEEDIIEVDTGLDENEQSELENIRKQAETTKTGFFLKRDGENSRELSTGDNSTTTTTDDSSQDEFVF